MVPLRSCARNGNLPRPQLLGVARKREGRNGEDTEQIRRRYGEERMDPRGSHVAIVRNALNSIQ